MQRTGFPRCLAAARSSFQAGRTRPAGNAASSEVEAGRPERKARAASSNGGAGGGAAVFHATAESDEDDAGVDGMDDADSGDDNVMGEYEVETVLGERRARVKGNTFRDEYHIKWKGYADTTWEPLKNVQNCVAYREYAARKASGVKAACKACNGSHRPHTCGRGVDAGSKRDHAAMTAGGHTANGRHGGGSPPKARPSPPKMPPCWLGRLPFACLFALTSSAPELKPVP